MIKLLPYGFQKCFGSFTIILVEGSFEIGSSRHYLSTSFAVRNFGNTYASRVIFFLKMLKIWARFWKYRKKVRKRSLFFSICNWSGCVKLSLLRKECLSSTVNVLTNSPKTFVSLRKIFLNSIYLTVINKYDKGTVIWVWTVFRIIYHYTCWRVLWNWTFYTFIWAHISCSITLEIH